MTTYTITSQAHTEIVLTPEGFPKCTCGGDFRITDYFAKQSRRHSGTTAVCKECDEYFCDSDIDELYEAIPRGQEARRKSGSSYKQKGE